jgi:hypothetical protein
MAEVKDRPGRGQIWFVQLPADRLSIVGAYLQDDWRFRVVKILERLEMAWLRI